MTERARREYAEALRSRYERATRGERSQMLDEYCRTTGCHRKSAIRRLQTAPAPGPDRRGRPRRYGPDLLPVLQWLWEISDRLCGKLLAPVLPVLVPALERPGALSPNPTLRQALLTLSPASIDRLLGPIRQRLGRPPRRSRPAAGSLKAQVPLRTWGDWRAVRPGALQGDLVLHCGESLHGFFLTTLGAVDVATGWTELEAVWGLGQRRVGSAVHAVRQRLPFPLREWHPDNGGEFLNQILVPWCRREGIPVTRGRGYRKNDQAYVEQKTWLAVRRLVGYDRFSSHPAYARLQPLYRLLRLPLNFFRPLRKLVSKQRVRAKVIKRYDSAQTPYQRVLAAGILDAAERNRLEGEYLRINPAGVSRQLGQMLEALWQQAETRRHRESPIGASSPAVKGSWPPRSR